MITIDADKAAAISRELNELSRQFNDLTPLMRNIAIRLHESTLARLQQGEQPDGKPFEPLSPNYVRMTASGRELPRPYQILVHTGKLRQGILPNWTKDMARISAGNNESRSYAARHQVGAPADRLPARPFIGLSEKDLEDITTLTNQFIDQAVSGLGQ